jgi:hypothetical protein
MNSMKEITMTGKSNLNQEVTLTRQTRNLREAT